MKARHVDRFKKLVKQPSGVQTLTIKPNITEITSGNMKVTYYKNKIVITKED